MSAPSTVRGNYSDLFGSGMLPVLEEIFKSELAQKPAIRSSLFKTVSTDRDIWQATEIHDMPLFSTVAEGEDYSYSKTRQGSSKTLTVLKYGLGLSVSEEAISDGKFDLVADAVRKMAQSAQESQEISAMNMFNNGFVTTGETASDGLAIFSTAHTLPSGGTFRNRLSSATDLSQSALDSALQDFYTQFVGDSGIIKQISPKVLLVAPANYRYAMELVGSDLKPDTANNNLNAFKSDGIRVVQSALLTDVDSWFLLAAPSETGLRIVNRQGIRTKSEEVFTNDSVRYKCSYREKVSCTHGYGIFGALGA